ncbi:hypothetical protein EST38_g11200 [Candolleomyces aberdarensis]|uniref:NLE domain-containing protein n=1 Tax=Candolleomyces aberdarensis TaxID=2316362 RepID=A0A4Q2D878_9AGAR|nr:hypothetical protein EST38_g11200 [Candolleomyces aberdarensis]
MIPTTWRRYHLSQLVNKALGLEKAIPFDFLVRGEILRTTLAEWCAERGVGEEETLEIEYIESVLPPQKISEFPHESWVSSVSCKLSSHFLTAAYDGHFRAFDLSRNTVLDAPLHNAPITSFTLLPSSSPSTDDTYTVLTASQDLTAQISQITLPGINNTPSSSKALATLHLHTSPVSSIAADSKGKQVLTSSWDGLIGLWDTSIPASDEVPEPEATSTSTDRKKRRKIQKDELETKPKRKAPLNVLKSHVGRVSKVVWTSDQAALSCGFDSTVRTWDVENGVCTQTITASEKPFLDITPTSNGQSALAVSTDRTMTMYDLRIQNLSAATASFLHPATPSCVAVHSSTSASTSASPSPTSANQVVTGAYDGVVRVWDVRSTKEAVALFKAFNNNDASGNAGVKKILSVDWYRDVVLVGGEGGLDVWKVQGGGDSASGQEQQVKRSS